MPADLTTLHQRKTNLTKLRKFIVEEIHPDRPLMNESGLPFSKDLLWYELSRNIPIALNMVEEGDAELRWVLAPLLTKLQELPTYSASNIDNIIRNIDELVAVTKSKISQLSDKITFEYESNERKYLLTGTTLGANGPKDEPMLVQPAYHRTMSGEWISLGICKHRQSELSKRYEEEDDLLYILLNKKETLPKWVSFIYEVY